MNKLLILFFTFLFSHQQLCAQENSCEVAMDAIKGTYTGDCINGKANGYGRSVGKDVYEGNFKKGYPDGKGKYTWQNKNFYEGDFKNGHLEGQGEMHYKAVSTSDSVVTGFWKKDKYIGPYEKAYIVRSFTTRIAKVDCRIISRKGNTITLTTRQLAGNTSLRNGAGNVVSITNIMVQAGTYYTKYDQVFNSGTSTRIQDVVFPFKAVFYLSSGDQTEIIFNQAAEYDVMIDIL